MKLPHRRQFLHLAAGAAALPALSHVAGVQSYPTRSIRLIVGFTGDIVARIIGQWLSERLGQPVIIENKPGAGSNISVQAVLAAPSDGYTLLFVTSAQAINSSLYATLPFNFLRDFSPVAQLADVTLVMLVNPSLPVNSVADFVAYAKSDPGTISMASYGTGTGSHLAGELFKTMVGVAMVHVPYRGSPPALSDLMAGRVEVMFDTILSALPHVRAGGLRALGVTGTARSELLPDIPTIGETVRGYEAVGWQGIWVRRGTPPEIVEKLNHEINVGLADRAIRARPTELATRPRPSRSIEFGEFVRIETEKWAEVVKLSGAKAE
jgi:tripartite-type tricarboxylate transporter receptor subunit TctC